MKVLLNSFRVSAAFVQRTYGTLLRKKSKVTAFYSYLNICHFTKCFIKELKFADLTLFNGPSQRALSLIYTVNGILNLHSEDPVPKYLYIQYTKMENNIEKEASVEDTSEEGPQNVHGKMYSQNL